MSTSGHDSQDSNRDEAEEEMTGAAENEKGPGAEQKAAEISKPADELEKARQEAAQYKDRYIRLYAEFENARKRMERERLEFVKYANEGLVAEFLSIMDDLERSVDAARMKHEDYAAFLKGIEMVMAHIYEMLKRQGLKPIEAKGKIFDPHCHEVLMQEETEKAEDGTVLEEFQKGYYLGERVVRTAKVKVARSKQ